MNRILIVLFAMTISIFGMRNDSNGNMDLGDPNAVAYLTAICHSYGGPKALNALSEMLGRKLPQCPNSCAGHIDIFFENIGIQRIYHAGQHCQYCGAHFPLDTSSSDEPHTRNYKLFRHVDLPDNMPCLVYYLNYKPQQAKQ